MNTYKLNYFIVLQLFVFFFTFIIFSLNNNLDFNIPKNFLFIFRKSIDLKDLGFFYGELIKNFLNFNLFYIELDQTKLFVGRPLFIAAFLTVIIKIISLEFFILFIKNSIFFSIYYFSVCEFFKKNTFNKYKFFLLIFAPYLVPYNLYQSFQLVPEESHI